MGAAEWTAGGDRPEWMYRYKASSLEGFIQQLAVSYVRHGYFFYVTGCIPLGKDPAAVDRKLIDRYGVEVSKWQRARQKALGLANVQYLRFDRLFVLMATHGHHRFFEDEAKSIRDFRTTPLRTKGYSVSSRGGHPHVRIDQPEYLRLKAYLLDIAKHRKTATVAGEFTRLPFEPYAPIRRQILCLWRAVNRERSVASFAPVPKGCLRLKRRVVKPFEESLTEGTLSEVNPREAAGAPTLVPEEAPGG